VPRSLRHFPVRDDEGKLDIPHLQSAIARIPQSKVPGLTPERLRELQDEARRLLARAIEEARKQAGAPFAKSIPLIKGVDPNDERYVLGVVLEPEVVDAQGDIYSAEEIRQAAHRFMEELTARGPAGRARRRRCTPSSELDSVQQGVRGLGFMHRLEVNEEVKVLESYLAPADLRIGEVRVRKGTWLLAVRLLSDELWAQVKDGELTGFSIGGSARRVPADAADAQQEAA